MLRRKYLFVLVVSLFLILFTACGKSSDNGTNAATATATVSVTTPTATAAPEATPTEEPVPTIPVARDLWGAKVVIVDYYTQFNPDDPAAVFDPLKIEYQSELMKKYNYTLERRSGLQFYDSEWPYRDALEENNPPGDIMLVTSGQIGKLFDADSGKCYASDLSELPEFDFSDEKWNQSVISLMTVGKGVYGFTCGKSNILGSRYQYVLYVNKNLLNSILGDGAVDQLYDLQASGEWTWDKLTEILTRCKAESKSAIGSQVYGLAAMGHDLFRAAMISDGHSFIGQDADGKLVSNLADPELIADLNWAYGLFADGLLNSGKKEKLLYGGELQLFTENKTAMLLTSISMIYTIQNSMPDTDLAMVCFPKGPKVTDYTLCSDQSIYIIPNCEATAAKLNDIAFAYDTYSDPYPEDVAPAETKREYSVLKSACDSRAYEETWSILSEKAVYMSNKESLIDYNFTNILYDAGNVADTPEEILAEYEPEVSELVNKFNEAFCK